MKAQRLILFFLFILCARFALAQSRTETRIFEIQSQVEAQIRRNMSNLIATQLASSSFEVAASVKVIQVPSAKPEENKKEFESMPAGMELGSVDVRELIESYKTQIEELKASKEATKAKEEPLFAISKVEVVVGLDESYDDAYVSQFKSWLEKRVRGDYGAGAVAAVNKTKPMPIKKIEPLPTKPVEPKPKDFFADYLRLISFFLLAGGAIVAAYFLSRGMKSLGEGAKSLIMDHKSPAATRELNQKIIAEENDRRRREDESLAPKAPLQNNPEDFLSKIAFLCLELGPRVNDLVRVWLDNGSDGFLKTAILIDTVVTLKEKVRSQGVVSTLTIPLDSDLASSYEVNISEAYRETAQMADGAKSEFLEKIYWDLVGARTLGLQAMRKPFDYLQSMNDLAFLETLKSQGDESKALALMFADPNKTKLFLENSDSQEKEKIVRDMIKVSQISKKQIWDFDSSVKTSMMKNSLSADENLVNLFPRTIDILHSLSPLEEIAVLRKISASLDDQGVTLKQQYTTLAFVDEWHDEYIVKLAGLASTSELVQLIHVIPEVRESILTSCSERMRMIILDDLNMQRPEDAALERSVKQLRTKWRNMCLKENISMGKVISFVKKDKLRHVA